MGTSIQREDVMRRREKVMALHVKGFTAMQIAAKLGLEYQTVRTDVNTIERGWRASPFAVAQYNTWLTRQLAKLDELERNAWIAWERSREPLEETSTELAEGSSRSDKGKQKVRVTRRESAGDPRFLATINSVIKQRSALLGLYVLPRAPIDPSKLSDEDLMKLAEGADPREILGDYAIMEGTLTTKMPDYIEMEDAINDD